MGKKKAGKPKGSKMKVCKCGKLNFILPGKQRKCSNKKCDLTIRIRKEG